MARKVDTVVDHKKRCKGDIPDDVEVYMRKGIWRLRIWVGSVMGYRDVPGITHCPYCGEPL